MRRVSLMIKVMTCDSQADVSRISRSMPLVAGASSEEGFEVSVTCRLKMVKGVGGVLQEYDEFRVCV